MSVLALWGGLKLEVQLVNPFLEAVNIVLPMLGFQNIDQGQLKVGEGHLASKGVTVLIGLTQQVKGNVAYNMTEGAAKKIASTMMMGYPVEELDSMAQSAISEMINMITGNAATNFTQHKIIVDISPPSLVVGQDFMVKMGQGKYIIVEILVDGELLELSISLNKE